MMGKIEITKDEALLMIRLVYFIWTAPAVWKNVTTKRLAQAWSLRTN